MKKSLAAFSAWALILALSVFVPLYILLTGTASLMPFAQAGAVAVCVIGLFLAAGAAALIVRAERKADISAHASLVKSKDAFSTFPLWRSVFVFLRTITQAVLLLALGEPLFAAFAIAGLIFMVTHKGMLDAYFDRLPRTTGYKVNLAQGNDGKMYVAGFGCSDARHDI